jgi:hypothetical protein
MISQHLIGYRNHWPTAVDIIRRKKENSQTNPTIQNIKWISSRVLKVARLVTVTVMAGRAFQSFIVRGYNDSLLAVEWHAGIWNDFLFIFLLNRDGVISLSAASIFTNPIISTDYKGLECSSSHYSDRHESCHFQDSAPTVISGALFLFAPR